MPKNFSVSFFIITLESFKNFSTDFLNFSKINQNFSDINLKFPHPFLKIDLRLHIRFSQFPYHFNNFPKFSENYTTTFPKFRLNPDKISLNSKIILKFLHMF